MVLGRADINRAAWLRAISSLDLTMPRPPKLCVDEFVGLTLLELVEEFISRGIPLEAARPLAAATYFHCPFPPVVQSAWWAAIKEIRGLSEVMGKLQCGRDGPNPDYDPLFDRVRDLLEETVGAVPRHFATILDADRNICGLEGADGTIYASRPDRDRNFFLLLGVEILHRAGKVTKVAAYEMMKGVIYLLEGKFVAPASVKRRYLKATSRYGRTWAKRRIDLSRLRTVLSKPEGRYVAVWAKAVKSPSDASSDAPQQASIRSPPPDGEKLSEELTKYKPVPKWAGPTGTLAKWMETGVPPTPDELPLGLAPAARARLWSLYDGSAKPPPEPARGLRRSSVSRKVGARRKLHRTSR